MRCKIKSMKRIYYLDNASTSFPKPKEVLKEICHYLKNIGGNPGRGSHRLSLQADRIIYNTRQYLAHLFNIKDSSRIIFTMNATESINLAIKGLLKKGDHVVTTSLEHNAVTRPLKRMEKDTGIKITKVSGPGGIIKSEDIKKAITSRTKLVVLLAASNVIGNILPIEDIGRICRKSGVIFLVDGAQAAGHIEIDVVKFKIDLFAFTGHKALFGPAGTGGLYIRKGIDITPLKEGATSSDGEKENQPLSLPDRYESGTLNTPGISGLGAGVRFILEKGIHSIREKEMELLSMLLKGLEKIKDVVIYGPKDLKEKVPLVSFNIRHMDPSYIGYLLDRHFNICVRTGFHCAYQAHKAIGTEDKGTVRVSLSYFNTREDIVHFLKAIKKISTHYV